MSEPTLYTPGFYALQQDVTNPNKDKRSNAYWQAETFLKDETFYIFPADTRKHPIIPDYMETTQRIAVVNQRRHMRSYDSGIDVGDKSAQVIIPHLKLREFNETGIIVKHHLTDAHVPHLLHLIGLGLEKLKMIDRTETKWSILDALLVEGRAEWQRLYDEREGN